MKNIIKYSKYMILLAFLASGISSVNAEDAINVTVDRYKKSGPGANNLMCANVRRLTYACPKCNRKEVVTDKMSPGLFSPKNVSSKIKGMSGGTSSSRCAGCNASLDIKVPRSFTDLSEEKDPLKEAGVK